MELKTVTIEKPADMNFILGQSHFIKTIEDLHEAIVQTVPGMKFGIGFCESSGPALVRYAGNDQRLIELAQKNALALACGHCFIIFMDGGFPINILNTIKNVPEVCRVFLRHGESRRGRCRRDRAGARYPRRHRRLENQGHRNRSRHQIPQRFPAQDRIQAVLATASYP